jgi:hypothetical protein
MAPNYASPASDDPLVATFPHKKHVFGRQGKNPAAVLVGAGPAVELAHILAAGMVQADYLPIRRHIEYRAAGAARLRGCAINDNPCAPVFRLADLGRLGQVAQSK